MKTLKYMIYCVMAAIVSLSATSCVEEQYAPGEPEKEGCYGVYFPDGQEGVGANYLDPEAPTTLTFKAARLNKEGAIVVPVVIEASEAGIFFFSEIEFEDGQEETEFMVDFPNAELGKTYSCTLIIEDPQYVQTYGQNPYTLAFSVSRIKWNKVTGPNGETMGKWRDDILTGIFNGSAFQALNHERDVEVYEQDGKKGYYRLDNLYSKEYVEAMCVPALAASAGYSSSSLFIDATDPDNVFIADQKLGLNFGSNFGEVAVMSDTEANLDAYGLAAASSNLFGTLKNGVIEFPADGLLITPDLYYANRSGKTRLILPGAKAVDYSLAVNAGAAVDGNLPVTFSAGVDLVKVKYALFEGKYDDGQIYSASMNIVNGKVADVKELNLAENTSVTLSGLATGIYTVVAVGYDAEGNNHSYVAVSFGYVAAGEEKPVVITAGLIVSDKYAPEGNTSENSVEYYVYGEDIEEARLALYETFDLEEYTEEELLAEILGTEETKLNVNQLKQLNGNGFSGVYKNLSPGTDYTFVVYANNGYEYKIVTASALTAGDPKPIYMNFSAADLVEDMLPATSEGYFGTYNYYAVDAYGTLGRREYLGKVTIADSATPDVGPDEDGLMDEFVDVSGLFAAEAEVLGFDNLQTWDYYNGVIYNVDTKFGQVTHPNGNKYYARTILYGAVTGGYTYSLGANVAFMGGYVAEGHIAFVSSGIYEAQGFTPEILMLGLFGDDTYGNNSFAGPVGGYSNLLLVDPKYDDYGLAPAPEKTSAKMMELNNLQIAVNNAPMDYVQTEKGRIRSIIDDMRNNPLKYAKKYAYEEVPMTKEAESVAFEVTPASDAAVVPANGSFMNLVKKF